MGDAWRQTADSVARELTVVFGPRLRSLVAYGPAIEGQHGAPFTCLALVDSLTISDLEACAARAAGWRRANVSMPLLVPLEEFRRSLDVFPLEYGEILRAHQTVAGEDLLAGIAIDANDLRRACETQVKSHLLHLREAYLESGGSPSAVAELVTASAPAFGALLRNVARLFGVHSLGRMETTLEGARRIGLPDRIVGDVLAFEQREAVPQGDAARLFPEYLAAVEQLAQAVDGWRAPSAAP